jgi:putative addiction module CopG family antidote
MDGFSIPPELERFATEAVAAGHYRDLSDVVRAGLELLLRRDQACAELLGSVIAARDEAERVGYLTGDEVASHIRMTIALRNTASSA